MHASAYQFGTTALDPAEVAGKDVIEAGAYDVNGSVRLPVESHRPATYTGTDMQAGPGVDVVCKAEDLPSAFGAESADVLISTEMLEHAEDWQAAMAGMIAVLRPGGVLLLTTRGPGFPRHGYPDDHWRFPVGVMQAILDAAALETDRCEPDPDPASPGVFVKARKPEGWRRPRGMRAAWGRIDVPGVP
jgi:SAM-dependent methyltransferase